MKKILRIATYVLLVPLITSCATADLSGFATQTANLMDSVAKEQSAITEKMNEVSGLTKLAAKEQWFAEPILKSDDGTAEDDTARLAETYDVAEYKKLRDRYINQTNAIEETLDAITKYSTSLAELSAAGENGKHAVGKAVGALNGMVTTLGGAAVLAGPSVAILEEIGDLVTRAQSEERIEDAMAILQGPDGAIHKTVELLKQLLDTIENNFVGPLYAQKKQLEQYRHGPGLIAFYLNTNSWLYKNRAYYFLNMEDEVRQEYVDEQSESEIYDDLRACFGLESTTKTDCAQATAASGLAARLLLISKIESEYRSYQSATKETETWYNSRLKGISEIGSALDIWAAQHDSIYESLEACGGFKRLKPGCGNWSESNIRSAIDKIQSIVPE